jgi:hypothetical protein
MRFGRHEKFDHVSIKRYEGDLLGDEIQSTRSADLLKDLGTSRKPSSGLTIEGVGEPG